MTQWLRLCAPNVGGKGSIPDWELRSHMPQSMAPKKSTAIFIFFTLASQRAFLHGLVVIEAVLKLLKPKLFPSIAVDLHVD